MERGRACFTCEDGGERWRLLPRPFVYEQSVHEDPILDGRKAEGCCQVDSARKDFHIFPQETMGMSAAELLVPRASRPAAAGGWRPLGSASASVKRRWTWPQWDGCGSILTAKMPDPLGDRSPCSLLRVKLPAREDLR